MRYAWPVAIALFLFGCIASAAPTTNERDQDAEEAAYLINRAVKVDNQFAIFSLPDPSVKGSKGIVKFGHAWGSGVVIKSTPTKSWVLTAHHVCDPMILHRPEAGRKTLYETSVVRMSGQKIKAEAIWVSPGSDLCVLSVEGYAGEAAQLATSSPPIGGVILHPGGPLGHFGDGTACIETGRYAGQTTFAEGVRSLFVGTTTHGASGGGIFYRRRLIGAVSAIASESGYPFIGATLDQVREAVGQALTLPQADAGASPQ